MTLSNAESGLLKVLEVIRADKNRPKSFGICGAVSGLWFNSPALVSDPSTHYGSVRRILSELFKLWPQFSGNIYYPVPDPNSSSDPIWAYDYAQDFERMWDRRTLYGRLRWELLNYCIDTLKGKQVSE